MNLTITELLREADNSQDSLVTQLANKLNEVIEEIHMLEAHDKTNACDKYNTPSDFDSQIEYIKKLVGLPNNY